MSFVMMMVGSSCPSGERAYAKKNYRGTLSRWGDGHVTIRIRPAVIVPAYPGDTILNRLPSLVRL